MYDVRESQNQIIEKCHCDGFRMFVVMTAVFMVMGCGKMQIQVEQDRGSDQASSGSSSGLKHQNDNAALNGDPSQKLSRPEFERANVVSLADSQHPWDGRPRVLPGNETVSNGDSKPPEMTRNSIVSCTEMQTQRCVSCCEDSFKFGSDSWDRCINACPQLGVEALSSEY